MNSDFVDALSSILTVLDSLLGSAPWFPFLLLGTGVFFSVYLKFPQLRFFTHAIEIVRGKFNRKGAKGDASHFQALTTAISGTVGTGNIGGVALAIYLGGPAALFWMWMTAFFGMTTKFVEVTLSHKYRVVDESGEIAGGPMYVMEKRLNMRWLAIFFAIATVVSSFGSGNLPQSNNIANGLSASFGIPNWVSGLVLASILATVILGGIKRIVLVAEKVVPVMALVYFLGALLVIAGNFSQIGESFWSIFEDAFTGSAAAGGFLGASFAFAFNRGVNRGLFSNEAGQGSAPIAHAAARTDEPVSEGTVSILEPFLDTIIICTLTGLVILSSGVWTEKHENQFQRFDTKVLEGEFSDEKDSDRIALFEFFNYREKGIELYEGNLEIREGVAMSSGFTIIHNRSVAENVKFYRDDVLYNGKIAVSGGALVDPAFVLKGKSLLHSVALTSEAFSRGLLGDYGRHIVSLTLVLFAFTTAVAWSYYGDRAMVYLFGVSSIRPYRIVYVFGFFGAAVADTSLIWLVSAITLALMAIPNLVSIFMLRNEILLDTLDYKERLVQGALRGKDI
ncbi:MAG: sodium:alanine symporter family protein [Gammaproteobacteria bacterium]|nr:sodium:alanine symporter family protein [Gammaproteobacteria bacterium]